jgi:uncharacterized membrane protein
MQVFPRHIVPAFAALVACFLAMDACWLTLIGPHLYRPALDAFIAPAVDWVAAALFYVIYLLGLTVFVVVPALAERRTGRALARGALFGVVAYATYDLTNQATLAGWPWLVTSADLAWGAIVSGVSAWVAVRPFAVR